MKTFPSTAEDVFQDRSLGVCIYVSFVTLGLPPRSIMSVYNADLAHWKCYNGRRDRDDNDGPGAPTDLRARSAIWLTRPVYRCSGERRGSGGQTRWLTRSFA